MLKDNLIMLRGVHGYSQEEIAGRIGISRQAYGKWESGATIPGVEKCKQLADVYGITIDSLVKTEKTEGFGVLPPAPKGKNIWGTVTINDRGQIVIPKAAREKYVLTGGKHLVVLSDEAGIALIEAEKFEEIMKSAIAIASKPAEL